MTTEFSLPVRDSKLICKVTLAGTWLITMVITSLLIVSVTTLKTHSAATSLLVCALALLFITLAYYLLKRGHSLIVSYFIILFYTFITIGIVLKWGINTPIAPLLFGLIIVLSGILLRARQALITAVFSGIFLMVLQIAINLRWYTPPIVWEGSNSRIGDVLAYWVLFAMLAIVSWLYNREMERSLLAARRAEDELILQNDTLEQKVRKRTAQLRRAQQEEMHQMYRFAELGQSGVSLLHDLANNLSIMTLELETFEGKKQAKDISHTKQVIKYLEDIIDSTRDRLQGGTRIQEFDIIKQITEVVSFLQYKAAKSNVTINWQPPRIHIPYKGDTARFCQTIAYIVSNAIDAYTPAHTQNRIVNIHISNSGAFTTIFISDWGKGISKEKQKDLFKPFQSSKKNGFGLGLFMTKQILKVNFSGTIKLNSKVNHTEFIIKLPHSKSKEKS